MPKLACIIFLSVVAAAAGALTFAHLRPAAPLAGWKAPALPTASKRVVTPSAVPAAIFDPVFRPCAHCHEIGVGARNKAGPSLNGIMGRRTAGAPGYPYSTAMRESGLIWTEETLARFLENPQAVVPGTRMMFSGVSDESGAKRIVEFLRRAGDAADNPRLASPMHQDQH